MNRRNFAKLVVAACVASISGSEPHKLVRRYYAPFAMSIMDACDAFGIPLLYEPYSPQYPELIAVVIKATKSKTPLKGFDVEVTYARLENINNV